MDKKFSCKTFPPDPLHCNLLGPVNSCLVKMESLWKEYLESYYRKHGLTRSGQGIGGNFNGVDIRVIIKEKNLQASDDPKVPCHY